MEPGLKLLLTSDAVRQRCYILGEKARQNQTLWFRLDESRLDECAEYVAQECLSNYPQLDIPYHSRWRHFTAGGTDLWQHYQTERLVHLDQKERTRTAIDLVFLSVLLDAGAGGHWTYREPLTGIEMQRSEGLAVASLDLFFNGFNRNAETGYRMDPHSLDSLSDQHFAQCFQHSAQNPLIGVEGRMELLKGLSTVLKKSTQLNRPGDLYDIFLARADNGRLAAGDILVEILNRFSSIWPGGLIHDGINIGDAGYHSLVQTNDASNHIVVFHKLSQWLSYSLIEPLQWSGMVITDLDQLTGLPEYRNGGLLIDTGVLQPIHPELHQQTLSVQSEAVVEWRALTVYVLDIIARQVRSKLNRTIAELPLASILQGGTWSAGRKIAAAKRAGGGPPLKLAIDGTVF